MLLAPLVLLANKALLDQVAGPLDHREKQGQLGQKQPVLQDQRALLVL